MTDLDALKKRFQQERWCGVNTLDEELFVQGFVPAPDLLDPWTAARAQVIDVPDWPRAVESIWQQAPDDRERLVRLDVFECDSRYEAHDFLIRLLGNFQSPLIERDERTSLGDVTFRGPGPGLAVFARANLVVVLRNAGPEVIAVGELAHLVDEELAARPREGGVAAPSIELATGREAIADKIALQVQVSDPLGLSVWLKVFTRGGTVAREKGSLFLHPQAEKPVQVTLFAINESRGVASATLDLSEGAQSP